MIIAFRSMDKEDVQSAYNMIAAALAITVRQRKRVVLVESGFGNTKVEEALGGVRGMIREPFSYMEGAGMDYLIKKSQYQMLGERTAKGGVLSVTDKLSYVPGVVRRSRGVYEEEFGRECLNILGQLDKISDYVLVDCGNILEKIEQRILERADLVVVNVLQSEKILNEYFSFPAVYQSKALYCIGNYIREDPCNMKNIQRMYKIDSRKMGVIPYNVEFLSSLRKGRAVSFFSAYPVRARNYRNRDFFQESFRMADMITHWEGWNGQPVLHDLYESQEKKRGCRQNENLFFGRADRAGG